MRYVLFKRFHIILLVSVSSDRVQPAPDDSILEKLNKWQIIRLFRWSILNIILHYFFLERMCLFAFYSVQRFDIIPYVQGLEYADCIPCQGLKIRFWKSGEFIAITPRSIQTLDGSIRISSMDQIHLFENYLYSREPYATPSKVKTKTKLLRSNHKNVNLQWTRFLKL